MRKNFRRYVALILSLVLTLCVFAGCSKKKNTPAPTVPTAPTEATEELPNITGRDYAVALDQYLAVKSAKTFRQYIAAAEKSSNALLDADIKALYAVFLCSDTYLPVEEKDYSRIVDTYKASFGEDYTVSYRVVTEEVLDKAALETFQGDLNVMAEAIQYSIDAMKGFDDAKWAEVGQMWGLSAEDAKGFQKVAEDACAKLKTLQVTEGYWLDVRFFATGSKTDGAKAMVSEEIRVYKVNGKWMWGGAADQLLALTEFNGY